MLEKAQKIRGIINELFVPGVSTTFTTIINVNVTEKKSQFGWTSATEFI